MFRNWFDEDPVVRDRRTKHTALQLAMQHHGSNANTDVLLDTAQLFYTYLTS